MRPRQVGIFGTQHTSPKPKAMHESSSACSHSSFCASFCRTVRKEKTKRGPTDTDGREAPTPCLEGGHKSKAAGALRRAFIEPRVEGSRLGGLGVKWF